MATIRYFVHDVERSLAFYTGVLGFSRKQQMDSIIAMVSKDDLTLWLSGPKSSAARPMPDGRRPESGGWNRLVLEVADLILFLASSASDLITGDNIMIDGGYTAL